jgi:hypothetical protein
MDDGVLDSPPSPLHSPDSLIRHSSGVLSILSLLFTVLLILTYGTGAAFRAVRVFFTTFILLFHAVSIVKFFVNGAYSEKSIQKSLFLSSDVHYATLFILFTFADLTPILTIVNYGIALVVTAFGYFVGDVLPLLGQTDNETIENAKRLGSHPMVTVVPVYLELALIFQLFVITAADWSLINFVTFVVYIGWIVAFNYATNSAHKQVWTGIGSWVNARVEANQSSYGPVLQRVSGKIAGLGDLALRWYK